MDGAAALAEGRTTLRMAIKLCIERYYEVFDEVPSGTPSLPSPISLLQGARPTTVTAPYWTTRRWTTSDRV